MSYDPMKGLHLHKHKISQIKGLDAELEKLLLLDGSRPMTGNLVTAYLVDGVDVSNHKIRHQKDGADEVSVEDLAGILADYQRLKYLDTNDLEHPDVRGIEVGGYLTGGSRTVGGVKLGLVSWTGTVPSWNNEDVTTTQPLPTDWTDKLICELPWTLGRVLFVLAQVEISSASTTKSCYARLIHTDYTGNTTRKQLGLYQKEQKDVADVISAVFFGFITVGGYEDYLRVQIKSDSPAEDTSYAKNSAIIAFMYRTEEAGF